MLGLLAQSVNLVFVFYTPREGLTSVLNIIADFSQSVGAEVSFEVMHYGIVDGQKLLMYLIAQSLVLVNVAVMTFDAISGIAKLVRERKKRPRFSYRKLVEPLTDLLCGIAVVVYICLRFPAIISTAPFTKSILSGNVESFAPVPLCFKNLSYTKFGAAKG